MIDLSGVVFLGLAAVGSVYAGCKMSPRGESEDEEEMVEVGFVQAIMFPVTASISLLLMFYYFWLLQYILLTMIVLGCGSAVYEIGVRIAAHWIPPQIASVSVLKVGVALLTLVIILEWLLRGNWIAHNAMGICLSISFISALRFPNLKIATLCMVLLFIYDMFWVFGSEHIPVFEGKNVMVEVATQPASNPVREIGEAMGVGWLAELCQKHIELPIKLLFPVVYTGADGAQHSSYTMLGLGDITLPGLLVNLALQFDLDSCIDDVTAAAAAAAAAGASSSSLMEEGLHSTSTSGSGSSSSIVPAASALKSVIALNGKRENGNPGLFAYAWGGYAVGLVCAFVCSFVYRVAQPALIYIVPGILLPLMWRARRAGVLDELWNGRKLDKE
jgi:hypothetical protein